MPSPRTFPLRPLLLALLVAVLALVAGIAPTPAIAAAPTIERASVDAAGGDPNGASFNPSIDRSGRHVAFWSGASDLVVGDDNFVNDIFVRDVKTDTTVRASLDMGGDDPNGESFFPTISASGSYVAFASIASDLVPDDGNGLEDIYVRDLRRGTNTRVTVDATGGDANANTRHAAISADGRHVVFVSDASDLVTGDGNGLPDVFVRDLDAGTTTRASVDVLGGDSNGQSGSFFLFDPPTISDDGRFAAFFSEASDLVADDANGLTDAFVRDLRTNQTIRVSVDSTGGDANGGVCDNNPGISADGRVVGFCSQATDLVPGDANGSSDVYVRFLDEDRTERVTVDLGGGDSEGGSCCAAPSRSGRRLAFASNAGDLVAGDGNGILDTFVRDLRTGLTQRVSFDTARGDPNGVSGEPSINGRGSAVAFHSNASDLVAADGNGGFGFDIFVWTSG